MPMNELPTPAALIDEARLMHNVLHMQQHLHTLGARLRPHVKTAKCLAVAERQRAAGAVGITVSTLKEAEVFFEAGERDILYAVGIAPRKLAAARSLRERGCALIVVVDSLAAAQAVVAHGRAHGHRFAVMIEVDTDGHRAGISPGDALLLEVGQALHEGGADLRGVLTHAGASYQCSTPAALQAMAEQERAGCVRAAERLRAAGLPCSITSGQFGVEHWPSGLSVRS
jgi:D-serine deaminase-like pyridoxal phosphate-dependent protein